MSKTDRVDEGEAQQEQSEPLRKGHGHISSSGALKPPDPQQLRAHLTDARSRKHVRSGATRLQTVRCVSTRATAPVARSFGTLVGSFTRGFIHFQKAKHPETKLRTWT